MFSTIITLGGAGAAFLGFSVTAPQYIQCRTSPEPVNLAPQPLQFISYCNIANTRCKHNFIMLKYDMKEKMIVNGLEVSVKNRENVTYISLTDIAKIKNSENPADVINKWMSNKDSFDFYCLWEELFNPEFNFAESREIKINEVGFNAFTMSPTRWKRDFNAIGIVPSAGKYSQGTFAHPDIALEFASWIDTPFKLFLIKEFQRLKQAEQKHLEWSAKRELAKINYHLQTNAIKQNLIVPALTEKQKGYVYADEADLLNVVLFGHTAKEWRDSNPDKQGNVRDYASVHQLLVLANMESYNSTMISDKVPQHTRMAKLSEMARHQLKVLLDIGNRLLLPK